MGSSFNPALAYEWGLVEGNSGLWIQRYHLWGTGLTLRRTPYNGRNSEYISEDPICPSHGLWAIPPTPRSALVGRLPAARRARPP